MYEINNKTIYDVLNWIEKDTDVYQYVKNSSPHEMAEGHYMQSMPSC